MGYVNSTYCVGNYTAPTKFENPFDNLHVRVIFITLYFAVFAVCLLGKLFAPFIICNM